MEPTYKQQIPGAALLAAFYIILFNFLYNNTPALLGNSFLNYSLFLPVRWSEILVGSLRLNSYAPGNFFTASIIAGALVFVIALWVLKQARD